MYEGFACAIRYDASVAPLIRSNYLYRFGYIGTDPLQYAKGSFDRLLRNDQTDQYPWLLQPAKTYFKTDDLNEIYYENCNMYRDFATTYSNIRLKSQGYYRLNMGFKVYSHWEAVSPLFIGHRNNFEIQVSDALDSSLATNSLSLLGVTTLAALCTLFAF